MREKSKIYLPVEASKLLVALSKAADFDVLFDADLRLRPHGRLFELVLPSRRRKRSKPLDSVMADLRENLGEENNPLPEPAAGTPVDLSACIALNDVLPILLLAAGEIGAHRDSSHGDHVAPESDDSLFIFRGTKESLEASMAVLQHNATTGDSFITAHGSEHIAFARLVDDEERDSMLSSFAHSDVTEGVEKLAVFPIDDTVLYLPEGIEPPLSAFRAFIDLTARDPFSGEFGGFEELAIIRRRARSDAGVHDDLQVFVLDRLRAGAALARSFAVEVVRLDGEPFATESQRDELYEAFDRHGYRVQLKSGFLHDPEYGNQDALQQRIDDIRDQILKLETELDYLATVENPSPILYRFDQSQLGQMIRTLSGLPISDLVEGHVLYGFAGTPDDPFGHHYVFFDPQSCIGSRPASDLTWWLAGGASPAVFNHDPFWAEHYRDNTTSHVFVPSGLALFPQLHSWKQEQMDDYLAEVMSGQQNVIPERPVYVFERAQRVDRDIRVTILDMAEFDKFPKMIGWFNKNLDLPDILNHLQDRIVHVAESFGEREVLEMLDGRRELAAGADSLALKTLDIGEFEKDVKARMQKSAGDTEAHCALLLQDITTTLADTTQEARRLFEESERLLNELEIERRYIEDYQSRRDQPGAVVAGAAQHSDQQKQSIAAYLEEIEANRAATEVAVDALVRKVTASVAGFRRRLKKVRAELGG